MTRRLASIDLPPVQPVSLDFLRGRIGVALLGKKPSALNVPNGIHQLHAELEVNLIVSGNGGVILGNRRYALGPGMLVWIPGGWHHCHVDRSGDWKMHICVCTRAALASFGEDHPLLGGEAPPPRRLSARAFQRNTVLLELIASCENAALAETGIPFLLGVLWDSWNSAGALPESPYFHPGVERAIQLMSEDPSLTTALLAHRLGMAPGYFTRRFRRDVGLSIQDYRNRMRMDRVLVQWKPDRSLLGLALDAGFGSYTHFHRVFVRIMGMSPRQWASRRN